MMISPHRYMVTNETLYHKDPVTGRPQVIGLGWLDDSMTPHGPTEEDPNYIADTGATPEDMAAQVAAYQESMLELKKKVIPMGGFWWQVSVPKYKFSSCHTLRTLCTHTPTLFVRLHQPVFPPTHPHARLCHPAPARTHIRTSTFGYTQGARFHLCLSLSVFCQLALTNTPSHEHALPMLQLMDGSGVKIQGEDPAACKAVLTTECVAKPTAWNRMVLYNIPKGGSGVSTYNHMLWL